MAARAAAKQIEIDPSSSINKLPQPYRRIDKIIAEIICKTFEECDERERKRREAELLRAQTVAFPPNAVYDDLGEITTFCASSDGLHMFVGNKEGQLLVVHLPSKSVVVRSNVHPGAVEALDVSNVPASRGTVLLASASKKSVCVYSVGFARSSPYCLTLLCSGAPPSSSPSNCISSLSLSSDGRSLVLTCTDGSLALYEIPVAADVASEEKEELPGMTSILSMTREKVVEILGAEPVGAPKGLIQIHAKRAPIHPGDTTSRQLAHLTNSPPPAECCGLFVHWEGLNRFLHFEIDQEAVIRESMSNREAVEEMKKKIEAEAANKVKGATPLEMPEGLEDGHIICRPTRDWVVPFPITSSCMMPEKQKLFTGLTDGSTIVWDTHLNTQVALQNRMEKSVVAMAYSRSEYKLALTASEGGEITLHEVDMSQGTATSDTPLAKPKPYGAINAIIWEGPGSLVQLLRDNSVIELYDINTATSLGEFQSQPGCDFLPNLAHSSLWHCNGGLLLVGGLKSSDSQEVVDAAPPVDAKSDKKSPSKTPEPPAQEEEEAQVPSVDRVLIFNVDEATSRLKPIMDSMAHRMASPMLQRMLSEHALPENASQSSLPSANSIPVQHSASLPKGLKAKIPAKTVSLPLSNTLRSFSLGGDILKSSEGGLGGSMSASIARTVGRVHDKSGGRNTRAKRMLRRQQEIAAELKHESIHHHHHHHHHRN
ncbi:hypothetical protein CYMTET_14959 [Cymbomonas tetramitiformis]|uniref:Uncharacterized protein n=1 Tax=Cymbomonas tetramitiformis TaxID=36881 RepID=A0AAE0GFJ2_9CHLO|nr:hypothetical protein CYMTET_14959 [Cymbomonas tetramitiformis]|eukprot:gene21421-25761_t